MGESIRIAIEDLFDTTGTLPTHSGKLLIQRAEVVVILDRSSGQQAVVYGLEKLHRQIEKVGADAPLMLVVEFDEESDNLAKLFGLIQSAKTPEEDADELE
ncbi:MAG TPA: hypothetical protein VFE46_15105 [Pirellulales bacterium]|jgi:hypothetical protein|nr:hypothetical protein [Pirellulales bacterium]